MKLSDLEALLKSAKTAHELFGDDVDETYRGFAMTCHPDRFATDTDEIKEHAKEVFQLLETRYNELKKPPVVWASAEYGYHLGRQIGKGEISNVHLASQISDKFVPKGTSRPMVLKVAQAKEANEYIDKEAKILTDLRVQSGDRKYSDYLPKPVEIFVHDGLHVAVQHHYDRFFTLSEIMARHTNGLGGRHVAWMFKRILTVIGFAHTANYIHCAVFPMHIMFNADSHGCKLISWAGCVRSEQKLTVVPMAYKPWYPKKEITKQYPATPSLDIFLAAKSMLELVKLDKENRTPQPLLTFLESCVVENPLQRPQDAWKLLDEWDTLLKKVYGPSKYVILDM
jgi:hypothetical protein